MIMNKLLLFSVFSILTLNVKMLNTEIKKILFIVVLLYEIIEFISRIERRLVRQY